MFFMFMHVYTHVYKHIYVCMFIFVHMHKEADVFYFVILHFAFFLETVFLTEPGQLIDSVSLASQQAPGTLFFLPLQCWVY